MTLVTDLSTALSALRRQLWVVRLVTATVGCLGVGVQPAHAEPARGSPSYAIAMHGQPALPAEFRHLPYVDPEAPKGGLLVLAVPGTFDSVNPYNTSAGTAAQGIVGYTLQSLMYRSLDEPFTMYGLVAQSIETDDARSYATFRIDPRARFSDGVPVTAEDVLFSFELLKTKGRPQQRDAYSRVKKAEALDRLSVRYDFTGLGDREMPLTLAYMVVLPRHATDAAHFGAATLRPLVGTGPYTITDVRPGQRLVLQRNRDYWGKDLPSQRGLYNFDEIRIDYFRDPNTMFEAFKAGLYDFRQETDARRWVSAYGFPAVLQGRVIRETVTYGLPKGTRGFVFNTRRAPFGDRRVRQALNIMFDAEWINAVLYSRASIRSRGFFDDSALSSFGHAADAHERELLRPYPDAVSPEMLSGTWTPPLSDGSGNDRAAARHALALLAAAGYVIENGRLAHRGDERALQFEIMVGDRDEERLALTYANRLRSIGVRADVRLVDDSQYQRRRQRFDFDMMLGYWAATPSPGYEQRSRWGSASVDQEASLNLAGVHAPAIDAMIEAFLAAKSTADFTSAVRAYDRLLVSGSYIVPLFYTPAQWIAYSDRITHPPHASMFGVAIEAWWARQAGVRGAPP